METQNQRLVSQHAVCLSSGTRPEVSNGSRNPAQFEPPHIFILASLLSHHHCEILITVLHTLFMNDTMLHKGVNKRDCCLSVTNIFTLVHSANVPSLAFTVTVQHAVGPLPTVWKFSTIPLPTCTLQAANITQKNTRSVFWARLQRAYTANYTAEGPGWDSESFRVVSCEYNTHSCKAQMCHWRMLL